MNKKYTKAFLIKELAERAEFSLLDVQYLWNTFEDLVIEIVKNKDTLMVGGLFKITTTKSKPHKYLNLSTNLIDYSKEGYKVKTTPSSNLKFAVKEPIDDDIEEIEEYNKRRMICHYNLFRGIRFPHTSR